MKMVFCDAMRMRRRDAEGLVVFRLRHGRKWILVAGGNDLGRRWRTTPRCNLQAASVLRRFYKRAYLSKMLESKIQIIKAPSEELPRETNKSVFLAGTTTPFDGVDWRERLCSSLRTAPITIYNPCNWDIAWEQGAESESFRNQVKWEMNKQELCDIIVIFFHPASQAPISLLELGMATRFPEKAIVACPDGYWKRGNVQVVCDRFGIEMVDSAEELGEAILKRL